MAVSPKGKRKITVLDKKFYWRIDKKNGLDDLEVIDPETHKAVRYASLARIKGNPWSEDVIELLLLGAEIYSHTEGEGKSQITIERLCVRPRLVREVILKRFYGEERRHKDRIQEAISYALKEKNTHQFQSGMANRL
jgi:hypothetical protein